MRERRVAHFLAPLLAAPSDTRPIVNERLGIELAARVGGAFDSRSRRRGVLGLDVDTELMDVSSGSAVWSGRYSEPVGNVVPLQRKLIAGILGALELRSATGDQALLSIPSELNSEAYRLLLKGKYASSRRSEASLKQAIGFFTEAADTDSRTAAYAGLASSNSALIHFTMAALRPGDVFPKVK
jgi:hypothetical protein